MNKVLIKPDKLKLKNKQNPHYSAQGEAHFVKHAFFWHASACPQFPSSNRIINDLKLYVSRFELKCKVTRKC